MTEPLGLTPSATVGPYLSIGLDWPDAHDLIGSDNPAAITIRGRLFDGAGDPVPDGMIEIWQADPAGRFDHGHTPHTDGRPARIEGFTGFGRCLTGQDGAFGFRTLKPGPLPAERGRIEAPHLDVSVFARGLLDRVVTRLYFPNELEANGNDPVLVLLEPADRSRLIAVPAGDGVLSFDIRLQGEDQTPFFRI
jgi:protocatechuate 3,4-dioxygenase alpha subunit